MPGPKRHFTVALSTLPHEAIRSPYPWRNPSACRPSRWRYRSCRRSKHSGLRQTPIRGMPAIRIAHVETQEDHSVSSYYSCCGPRCSSDAHCENPKTEPYYTHLRVAAVNPLVRKILKSNFLRLRKPSTLQPNDYVLINLRPLR